MHIQLIRNACVRLTFGGKVFLTDPWLMDKGAMKPLNVPFFRFCRPEQARLAMPLCDLPMPRNDVLAGIDAYIVTHVHPDHVDMNEEAGTVGEYLDKNTPVFVQSEEDAYAFLRSGFTEVTVLYENSRLGDIALIKTPARHGTKIPCGKACGVVLQAQAEKTCYIAGDTIWYDGVKRTIDTYQPKVILLNACAATFMDQGRLIMDDADIEAVYHAAPEASLLAIHMENVAHAFLTRASLRECLAKRGIADKILIPDDGQTFSF